MTVILRRDCKTSNVRFDTCRCATLFAVTDVGRKKQEEKGRTGSRKWRIDQFKWTRRLLSRMTGNAKKHLNAVK